MYEFNKNDDHFYLRNSENKINFIEKKGLLQMKISKVNHRRSAVSKQNTNNNIGGIIYDSPAKNKDTAVVDLNKTIESLVKKSSNLYSPLTNINSGLEEDERKLKRKYNEFVKKNAKSGLNDKEKTFNPNIKSQNTVQDLDKQINKIVDKSLRKSLCRTVNVKNNNGENVSFYLPELVKKSMQLYLNENRKSYSESEQFEMYVLFSSILEDKNKNKQKKEMEKSITNQTTKVKVVDSEKGRILVLSIADTKKKPLWDFVINLANAENNDEILGDIRRKIVLYTCGSEICNSISAEIYQNNWDWEKIGIDKDKKFINNDETVNESSLNIDLDIIRKANIEHYRAAVNEYGDEQNKFWFKHFENVIETLFSKKSKRTNERIMCLYLCEYLWKDFCSYIATKYIELGKGVYHFTMQDKLISVRKGDTSTAQKFGIVDSKFSNGITSFDYEYIKAEEEIERNISTYTTFATNIFAKAVVNDDYRMAKDNNSDVLQYKEFLKSGLLRTDACQNLFQYWGGYSKWKDIVNKDEVSDLCNDIKNHLNNIRNSSVHYTAKTINSDNNKQDFINLLFENECAELINIYASKYYSNNLWMFYGMRDIGDLMSHLYSTNEVIRDAQIPSFNSIIKRKDIVDVMGKTIKKNSLKKIKDIDLREKYRAALYFIFKEIYYKAFLNQPDLKNIFLEYLDEKQKSSIANNNPDAIENFCERINSVKKDCTFGELCQVIMTDYNMQNQGKKEIESKERQDYNIKKGHDKSYKHFPLLLHQILREMFIQYIKNTDWLAFIREPNDVGISITLEEFKEKLSGVKIDNGLEKLVDDNYSLLDWYVLAHFLMPKQLNHLIGDIKNYIQYSQNVRKRANSVGIIFSQDNSKLIEYYYMVVKILDFAMLYTGKISNVISDYFASEDEYVEFLSNYVDFCNKTKKADAIALKAFCQDTIQVKNDKYQIGLYWDGENPILNRNIAFAKMYSDDRVISKIYNKVTKNNIQLYYKQKNLDLSKVFENGVCQDDKQQKMLCKFQQNKNHIELTEISIYTDILNDLMSQFISWAYIRERDLLYFQLGVHYLRLFYNNDIDNKFRQLHGECINIDEGALLYQIVAMYSHDLSVYKVEKDGNAIKSDAQGSSGAGVKGFVEEYCGETMRKADTYEKCLEFFEDLNQHNSIIKFRNDIVHMRYMTKQNMSIMEMMSFVYNSFFFYDTKLKKSVSFILKNILLRYAVVAKLEFQHHEDHNDKNLISFKPLESDKYTYKLSEIAQSKDNSKNNAKNGLVVVDVRNNVFLEQLEGLLNLKSETKAN